MYIFKKQAVLLTNRLNFKSKRVRNKLIQIPDCDVIEEKKKKYYNQNIFNKYEVPFANICRFNFGLNFFMSRAS